MDVSIPGAAGDSVATLSRICRRAAGPSTAQDKLLIGRLKHLLYLFTFVFFAARLDSHVVLSGIGYSSPCVLVMNSSICVLVDFVRQQRAYFQARRVIGCENIRWR